MPLSAGFVPPNTPRQHQRKLSLPSPFVQHTHASLPHTSTPLTPLTPVSQAHFHGPNTPISVPPTVLSPSASDTPDTAFLHQDMDALVDACMAFLALRLPIITYSAVKDLFSKRISLSRHVLCVVSGGPPLHAMSQIGAWFMSQSHTAPASNEHMSLCFVWLICFIGMRCLDQFATVPTHPYAVIAWTNVVRLLPGTLQRQSPDSAHALAMTALAVMPSKFGPVDPLLAHTLATQIMHTYQRRSPRMTAILRCCIVLEGMANDHNPVMTLPIDVYAHGARDIGPRILCTALMRLEQNAAAFSGHLAAMIKLRTLLHSTPGAPSVHRRFMELSDALKSTVIAATCNHAFCTALVRECSELRTWLIETVDALAMQAMSTSPVCPNAVDHKCETLWPPPDWTDDHESITSLDIQHSSVEMLADVWLDSGAPDFTWPPLEESPALHERSPYFW